jgi:type VI secretion system protein ImpG
LISHLSLNYLSLEGADPSAGATMLRGMLALYADPNDASVARQIEGLRSVTYRPVVRRMPRMGPASYGRGLEIAITADDAAFEGIGIVPLAGVLERFFARYVSINAFTQMKLQSSLRGDIKTWPVRLGSRQTL